MQLDRALVTQTLPLRPSHFLLFNQELSYCFLSDGLSEKRTAKAFIKKFFKLNTSIQDELPYKIASNLSMVLLPWNATFFAVGCPSVPMSHSKKFPSPRILNFSKIAPPSHCWITSYSPNYHFESIN